MHSPLPPTLCPAACPCATCCARSGARCACVHAAAQHALRIFPSLPPSRPNVPSPPSCSNHLELVKAEHALQSKDPYMFDRQIEVAKLVGAGVCAWGVPPAPAAPACKRRGAAPALVARPQPCRNRRLLASLPTVPAPPMCTDLLPSAPPPLPMPPGPGHRRRRAGRPRVQQRVPAPARHLHLRQDAGPGAPAGAVARGARAQQGACFAALLAPCGRRLVPSEGRVLGACSTLPCLAAPPPATVNRSSSSPPPCACSTSCTPCSTPRVRRPLLAARPLSSCPAASVSACMPPLPSTRTPRCQARRHSC